MMLVNEGCHFISCDLSTLFKFTFSVGDHFLGQEFIVVCMRLSGKVWIKVVMSSSHFLLTLTMSLVCF